MNAIYLMALAGVGYLVAGIAGALLAPFVTYAVLFAGGAVLGAIQIARAGRRRPQAIKRR